MSRRTVAFALIGILAMSSPMLARQRTYKGSHSYSTYGSRSYSSGYVNPSHTTVRSYTTHHGTYVPSYRRTSPDHSKTNNYSSRGNVNPYTGKRGYKRTY